VARSRVSGFGILETQPKKNRFLCQLHSNQYKIQVDYTSLVWSANLPTVIFPIYRIQGACMSACARMWVVSTLIFLLFGSAWIFLFIFVWHCYRKKCQKQTNPSTVKGKTNWKNACAVLKTMLQIQRYSAKDTDTFAFHWLSLSFLWLLLGRIACFDYCDNEIRIVLFWLRQTRKFAHRLFLVID